MHSITNANHVYQFVCCRNHCWLNYYLIICQIRTLDYGSYLCQHSSLQTLHAFSLIAASWHAKPHVHCKYSGLVLIKILTLTTVFAQMDAATTLYRSRCGIFLRAATIQSAGSAIFRCLVLLLSSHQFHASGQPLCCYSVRHI